MNRILASLSWTAMAALALGLADTGLGETGAAAGCANVAVTALVADPRAPRTLYAGTRYDGIFKTVDGGISWKGISDAGLQDQINSLAVDPVDSSVLYAGTNWYGLLTSSDAGTSWQVSGRGLKAPPCPSAMPCLNHRSIYSLAIDPRDRSNIFAGATDGLFRSVNGGRSWFAVTGLAERAWIFDIAFDPVRPTTVYAGGTGLFRSDDGGESWSRIGHDLPRGVVRSLAFDPRDSSRLYSGTDFGAFRSTNGGITWVAINQGFPIRLPYNFYVLDVAAHPVLPGTLYAGTHSPGGMFKSADGGESWKRVAPGTSANTILVSPSETSVLYAGTPRGVWKSTDGGETWGESFDLGDIPQIESLSPTDVRPATETYTGIEGVWFYLVVKGKGFLSGSTVHFNGVPRPTSMPSCTRLMARIPFSDIATPGTAAITVVNPPPGGATSAPFPLAIHPSGLHREPSPPSPRAPRILTRD